MSVSAPEHEKAREVADQRAPAQDGPEGSVPASPVALPAERRPAGRAPNAVITPPVLVLGAAAGPARTPAQSDALAALQAEHDRVVTASPPTGVLLAPALRSATDEIDQLTAADTRRSSRGLPEGAVPLADRLAAVVARFATEAKRLQKQQQWEDLVAARHAFVAGKGDAVHAEQALARAADDVVLAGRVYDELYSPLGFAADLTARTAGNENALLELKASIPAPLWPTFLTTVSTSDELMAFALTNGAQVAADADPSSVLRVWHGLPSDVATAAVARGLLGLATLVGGDVAKALRAGKLLGTDSVPDVAKLEEIDADGTITTIARVEKLAGLGGDPLTNHRILKLADPVSEDQLKEFNSRLAKTHVAGSELWTALTTTLPDAQKRAQVIRSFAKAPDAGSADLTTLLDNWDRFHDRTAVSATQVASLVTVGVLVPAGNLYTSGEWGKGCVYTFNFAGQGRIEAEWHIHYAADGAKTRTVGAGWKNASQKHDRGVKTFDQAPKLITAITAVGRWKVVRI